METIEIIESGGTQIIEIGFTGPTGTSGGSYTHTQSVPALTWTITHNLGYHPNVAVEDIDGFSVDALISWPTVNTVICAFGATLAGKAYLS